jgi:hypothetical protein
LFGEKKNSFIFAARKQKRSEQTGITGKLIMNDGLTWQGTYAGAGSQVFKNAGIAQLVEHDLAKVGVASSSLVSRSLLKA